MIYNRIPKPKRTYFLSVMMNYEHWTYSLPAKAATMPKSRENIGKYFSALPTGSQGCGPGEVKYNRNKNR